MAEDIDPTWPCDAAIGAVFKFLGEEELRAEWGVPECSRR